mmetsp:Transcript_88046/g.272739  ORF Transcript_88046/g.272739 Transcript_88046/m.272739 type:complete len:220 (-) Transcript_88046:287-946(-)
MSSCPEVDKTSLLSRWISDRIDSKLARTDVMSTCRCMRSSMSCCRSVSSCSEMLMPTSALRCWVRRFSISARCFCSVEHCSSTQASLAWNSVVEMAGGMVGGAGGLSLVWDFGEPVTVPSGSLSEGRFVGEEVRVSWLSELFRGIRADRQASSEEALRLDETSRLEGSPKELRELRRRWLDTSSSCQDSPPTLTRKPRRDTNPLDEESIAWKMAVASSE